MLRCFIFHGWSVENLRWKKRIKYEVDQSKEIIIIKLSKRKNETVDDSFATDAEIASRP